MNCTAPNSTNNLTLCKLTLYQTRGPFQNKEREIAKITLGEENEIRLHRNVSKLNATADAKSPAISLNITEATCEYAGSYLCEVIQLQTNVDGRNVKNECQKDVSEQENSDSAFVRRSQTTFIEGENMCVQFVAHGVCVCVCVCVCLCVYVFVSVCLRVSV